MDYFGNILIRKQPKLNGGAVMSKQTWGVAWYLAIAFGLAWGVWEAVIRSGVSVLSWEFQLFCLPGAFAPAIACFVVRKWITREGFADAGLGLHLRRWPYYLLAWLLPLAVVGAITAEAMVSGIAQPDFTLASAIAAHPAGRDISGMSQIGLLVIPQLMATALIAIPVLWGEEFGWRSYLQQRLFPGRPVAAAVATGLIWGAWHLPVTLRGYDFPDHPVLGSALLTLAAVLLAYIFGWIRERSGSIWASSLAHSSTNAVGSLATLWFAGAAGPSLVSYAGLLAMPPLFLVCVLIWLGGYRARKAGPIPA
jgi:membrane protease YdiL (CAAX protease family)